MENIFAHTFGRVDMIAGMVRLELTTLLPDTQSGSTTPVATTEHAVFMPLEGFLRGYANMQNVVQQLAQAGLIRLTPAETPAQAE